MEHRTSEALRASINEHPILALPPEERLGQEKLRMELIHHVMQYTGFEKRLQGQLENVGESALVREEQELEQALYHQKSRTGKFDGCAFLLAMNSAIKGWCPEVGVCFLDYFFTIYKREIYQSAKKQEKLRSATGISLSREESRLWRKLTRLCEKLGYDWNTLPARYCSGLAESLQIDENAVRRILQKSFAVRKSVQLDAPLNDEGDTLELEDPQLLPAQQLEWQTEIMDAIEMFADADHKEYPRLFFTNDVLGPMCEEKTAAADYYVLLQKKEDRLWNGVFLRDYIEFLFLPPPIPNCLENILRAKQAYPLKDSTIALYKEVTPAAVSYQRKRYTAFQKNWKELGG